MLAQLGHPLRSHPTRHGAGGEVVAKRVAPRAVDRIGAVVLQASIHPHVFVAKAHMIARHGNHAFYKMLCRVNRIMEDDNVAALDRHIRLDGAPNAAARELHLINQKVIAHQQRVLHGFRWNLKGLCCKCDDEQRDHNGA